MVQGLVSIITPTYNSGRFISETIKSVQAQSYRNWEMLIVDDCSIDNTMNLVKPFIENDSRIKYHYLDTNSGAAIARNTAMKIANGEYIAFCDSDDLWMPDKLERQLSFMKEHNLTITCTAYEQIDEEGKSLNRVINSRPKCDYNRLLLDCPVGNSTVIYNAKILGRFEVPNIRKRNDDALWLQMLKKEQYIWGMPDVLMRYRIRENSVSNNKLTLVKYHWVLYRNIEHLSISKSIFHIGWWFVLKVFRIK